MSFNSLHFLVFFPIVVGLYFSLPHRFRWLLLLISSYYFYMSWKAEFIFLIIFTTLIDYVAGIQMEKAQTPKRKKTFLVLSLIMNLGLLFTFKYFNFVSASVRELLQLFSIPLNPLTLKVLLPVGISFYTFQSLSYTIDVYRGKISAQKHLGIFALYVSYFPQLVAGPIERAKNLLPQFLEKHYFDYKRVTDGLKLMLWGFFKKIVIADRLAAIVDTVYNNPTDYTGIPLILATVFFAFQIYCDFSGYSDIAIGAAQVMGFKLMNNFQRPYFSRSISEFWRRWHISLSTWFKDYLYIPLGGNRVTVPRWYLNIFIVFVISGFWHGANFTFVVWGALHGLYLILETATKPVKDKIYQITRLAKFPSLIKYLEIAWTFILVNVGWVFFRADSLTDAFYILTHWFTGVSLNFAPAKIIAGGWLGFAFVWGIIGLMELIHVWQERGHSVRQFLSRRSVAIRWASYLIMIFSILLLGVFERVEFIYFQF